MQWTLFRSVLVASIAIATFAGSLRAPGIQSSRAAGVSAATPGGPKGVTLPDFAGLVEQVGPAVVNIRATSSGKSKSAANLTRRFNSPPQQPHPGNIQRAVGSGFIISADGYVMTNQHVVDDADEVIVRLTDKREFKASVIGSDERTDVALIKINANGLPFLKMGDPNKARVGEWVIAVGSPFGLDSTVTAGIISAKGRRLPGEGYVPLIQTDVAINPGNSGGPLFNMNGEVIAINSGLLNSSGVEAYAGVSLAIPIDVALKVKDQLLKTGKVIRGVLGLGFQEVDADLAESLGLEKVEGSAVTNITKGSGADKAGIKTNDVILEVDGARIEDSNDLQRMIGERAPGETISLKIWRNKTTINIKATLGAAAGSTSGSRDMKRGANNEK